MTRGEFLGGCLVALLITCSPGLAGVVVTALTGPDRLDAPTTSSVRSQGEGDRTEEHSTWVAPRPRVRAREASRSRLGTPKTAASSGTLPLILQRIRKCESANHYHGPLAENPTSTASGAFQITDGTWNGFAGYHHAADAPRSVQDAKALALYRDRGTQPWNATRGCWA